jgi:hypothetical protein
VFEENFALKMQDPEFLGDISPLNRAVGAAEDERVRTERGASFQDGGQPPLFGADECRSDRRQRMRGSS